MSSPRHLADRFHRRWLETHPLAATSYGIPGYDDRVPDDSEAGDQEWRAEVLAFVGEADSVDRSGLALGDVVTLDCLVEAAAQEVSAVDSAPLEHTVTAMPFSDPGFFLAVAARSVMVDAAAAEAYVTRLRGAGRWIDQLSDRLRAGAAKGCLPVAPLMERAVAWGDGLLSPPAPAPLLAPRPPERWDGAPAWEEERLRAAADVVRPALARWVATVRDLLPAGRDSDHPGLCHIPGGEEDYRRAVRAHTTLDASPERLHRTGLHEIAVLEDRARQIGGRLGLASLQEVFAAVAASAGQQSPEDAIALAVSAIRRAEGRAPEIFPGPLPAPCAVTPMPSVVASSGAAPHYTPPRLDGGRPGTFWFNTEVPTAGTGWDLEVVAFHEAVPGHHLQLSRVQLLTDLPALQRQRSLTVFSEGWGLYAEQLAEEVGLYSDAHSLLGAVTASLMRAARLVIDTGLHAFGWTRQEALAYFSSHVPLPASFLSAEVDRYIVMPGQALSYLTGKLELLGLRAEAQKALGSAFSLPAFHAAVLDRGSLPMPVLRTSIRAWVDDTLSAGRGPAGGGRPGGSEAAGGSAPPGA
ncbi:MAG TPA: DUF885 domain-containing protein [Acidimicrobiales bacterium]|nr:DUF885 domain-containing protein [Acidimicrobiales bacterium]